MAIVGISALRPDLVVLDEFQRFKDLLHPDPANFAAELAHRLFNYVEPETRPTDEDAAAVGDARTACTRRPTRPTATTTPTSSPRARSCSGRRGAGRPAAGRFDALRGALTSAGVARRRRAHLRRHRLATCASVMARTERLAATPDRDGMLARARRARRRSSPTTCAPTCDSETSPRRSTTMSPRSTGRPAPTSSTSWSATSSRRRSTERPPTARSPTASDSARARAAELGRRRGLRADRPAERPAALAARRPRPPSGVRAAVDPAVAALLRHRVGVRVRRGDDASPSGSSSRAGPSSRRSSPSLVSFEAERQRLRRAQPPLHGRVPAAGWPAAHVPHRRAHGGRAASRRGRRRAPSGGHDRLPAGLAERRRSPSWATRDRARAARRPSVG